MKYILASRSPRRNELLKTVLPEFLSLPADIDEETDTRTDPFQVPEALALKKARHIAAENKDAVVIGFDTAVFIDNKILGKPGCEAEAFGMLRLLSGKTHEVITGCALVKGEKEASFSVRTRVTFYELSDEEINAYIKTKEPMDKAGAYGIQGRGSLLVKEISGDYFNVVGLPVSRLSREIKSFVNAIEKNK